MAVGILVYFNGGNQVGNVYIDWWNEVAVAGINGINCCFILVSIYQMRNLIYLKSSIKTGRGLWIFVALYTLQAVALMTLAKWQIVELMCLAGTSTFLTNVFLAERLTFLLKPCEKTQCPISGRQTLDIAARIEVDDEIQTYIRIKDGNGDEAELEAAKQRYLRAVSAHSDFRQERLTSAYTPIDMRILEGLIEQVTNDTLFRQMGIKREKGSFVLGHATQS